MSGKDFTLEDVGKVFATEFDAGVTRNKGLFEKAAENKVTKGFIAEHPNVVYGAITALGIAIGAAGTYMFIKPRKEEIVVEDEP